MLRETFRQETNPSDGLLACATEVHTPRCETVVVRYYSRSLWAPTRSIHHLLSGYSQLPCTLRVFQQKLTLAPLLFPVLYLAAACFGFAGHVCVCADGRHAVLVDLSVSTKNSPSPMLANQNPYRVGWLALRVCLLGFCEHRPRMAPIIARAPSSWMFGKLESVFLQILHCL